MYYPKDKTIISLFEKQALDHPAAVAVVFGKNQYTYEQLNARSNQLSYYLQINGVTEEALVPVCMERSAEMIVAILGILKAGAAYVPIDPDYPLDRIKYMLHDTQAKIVITDKAGIPGITAGEKLTVLDIDSDWQVNSSYTNLDKTKTVSSHQLAYVIYTSGSTGRPKGVMIEHSALLDHCFGVIESAGLRSCKSFALFSPLVFDAGHSIIHASFILGAAVHVLSTALLSDGEKLHDYINGNNIDCIKIVPSLWLSYANGGNLILSKKVMIFGGESFSLNIVDRLAKCKYGGEVYNHYGPTETTIGKCIYKLNLEKQYSNIPIGQPFSNTRIYILDQYYKPVDKGMPGEIFIAGDGLARGYLNLPELTATKFIDDPFSSSSGDRMYATGDLGKWLADGNIEYKGRKDEQVKINGYRIELGEIENTLAECDFVNGAVVLAKTNRDGSQRLIAYVVLKDTNYAEALQAYIKTRLPEYMIPLQWVYMESLPLTINGKIDRKLLPEPELNELLNKNFTPPRTAIEIKLAVIWQQLLHIERLGIHDNFFHLGGHSLLAMRMISTIRKESKVEVALKNIFSHPTIAAFAKFIETQGEAHLPPIERMHKQDKMPLSFNQEGLWFIDQLAGSLSYHLPNIFSLKGNVNITALSGALQQIINRHEILRTVIRDTEGQGYQYLKEKDAWKLSVIDGLVYKEDAIGLQNYIQQLIEIPFNLATDYMLRATLIGLGCEDHILIITLHHIASDAWSASILMDELSTMYNALVEDRPPALSPLPFQYADYSIWQRTYLRGEVLNKKLGYWKGKLEGANVLQMPADYPRPLVQTANGAMLTFQLRKEISDKLQALSQQQDATLFMSLLSALNILLYRYSGQEDICVGVPTAGRYQHEVENLIGFFVNTLVLRTELVSSSSFKDLLQQVKMNTLEAYENHEVPFQQVVESVVKERDTTRNPLFQVMLVWRSLDETTDLQLNGLQLCGEPIKLLRKTTSKFELTFLITETLNGLDVSIEYSTDLFMEITIKRMIHHFEELVKSIVESPETSIGKLPMLTQQEQHQQLFKYNSNSVDYPKDKTIVHLFEEQVIANPGSIALVFENTQVTYKQLNEYANQLANYLRCKGVKENTIVPIFIERGIEMIVGIMAVLKAGGAYVPLDPEYSTDRICYVLEDTASTLVLSSGESSSKLTGLKNILIIKIDVDWIAISEESENNFPVIARPDHLAYVIYTSGSTGKPKGVLIEHKSLAASLLSRRDYYKQMESILLVPSFAFDCSLAAIFGSLITGGKLIITREHEIKETAAIKRLLDQSKTILCVPSYYRFLLEDGLIKKSSLTQVILGGEKLEQQLVAEHFKHAENISLYNEYGPTEGTIWSTVAKIETGSNLVTIGKPINTVKIYIVNKDAQLVPEGATGEICIAGVQVARGYQNLPELTSEKFIGNPFIVNEKMYKTGDLGRWLADGSIEYLGRMDDQVKIRGYRIELGGIEHVLQDCEAVRQAVVMANHDADGNNRLIGYVIPEGVFDPNIFISYLKSKLPEYMIPALWVEMERFPLTSNGKIDKNALPGPAITVIQTIDNSELHTEMEMEKVFVNTWRKLLNIETIGIHDNFFFFGGHSILAMRMVSTIRKELGIDISVNDLFTHPTIKSLITNCISKTEKPLLHLVNFKYLVPIKPGQNKVALYIVAGGGGTAFRFKRFAELLECDQPVYVLQPPTDTDELNRFPTEMPAIANKFIEEILVQNPEGPYALSGHCLGGIIAFEMAKQLEAKGKKVQLLAMFDTIIKDVSRIDVERQNIQDSIRRSFSKYTLKIKFESFLLKNHTKQYFAYKMNTMKSLLGRLRHKPGHNNEMENVRLQVFDQSAKLYKVAGDNYKLAPYNGELFLFYAKERYYFTDVNKNIRFNKFHLNESVKKNWQNYAASISIYDVEGDHSDMFDLPNANQLAKLLTQQLNKSKALSN
ncbi:MAG: amino acid adenylation domain-containing protein [Ferruginibacter sp.]